MSLLTVKVGGLTFVVDAPNKGTAKAFGRKQIEVEVADATADDITAHLAAGHNIEKLVVAEKAPAAEATAEEAAA